MKYINLILIVFICIIFNTKIEKYNYDYILDASYFSDIIELPKKVDDSHYTTYGTITAYTPYCDGCIGITAFGYDVRNNIFYDDLEYGSIRIIAADRSIPFGSIIRLDNNMITIVLDRGGAIGFNNSSQIDLLFSNKNEAYEYGRKNNMKLEILRYGF